MNASSHRRRQNNQGIDLPPSLFINGKKTGLKSAMELELVPLQLLCELSPEMEGSSGCQPIIFGQRYIVTSSFRGSLKFYQLSQGWEIQLPPMKVLPKWRVEILDDVSQSRIVAILSLETSDKLCLLGYIVLTSNDGHISVVKVRSEHDEPELVYSAMTHLMNVVSIAGWIQDNCIHLIVATQGGRMEEWKFTTSEDGDWADEILWKGSFHTSLHSILAVGGAVMTCISQMSGMEQKQHFTTVEVLNRSMLLLDWKEKENDFLPLANYCMWPEQGREWVRTSEKRHDLVLGSNVMLKIDSNNWSAALDDGSVAILNSSILLEAEGGSWGLLSEDHRVTLAYPAIGLGKIEMMGKSYLTCCLRGGTVYCIPIDNDNENGGRKLKFPTFLPPSEDEEDYAFLHGFVSGNVRLFDQEGRFTSSRPIIVYEGPGGILEVYSCGLILQSDQQVSDQIIMEKLMQNGCIKFLLDGLQSVKEGDELLKNNLWVEAREECLMNDIEIHDIVKNPSNLFKATRALLLSLSK